MNDITVVIRCKSDDRVFDCIRTVGDDAEVMVSVSPDEVFEDELTSRGIPYCVSGAGNLSVTSNAGIAASRTEKVVVTDSDTLFGEGTVTAMSEALDDFQVCRARLLFETSRDIRLSGPVSNAREFVNSKRLAFTPGLGMRKTVGGMVGGRIFDEASPFAVDANLNYRLNRAGIEVCYLDRTITHRAEDVRHDLRAARRIGDGVVRGSESLYGFYGGAVDRGEIRRSLKAVHFRDYPQILRRYGVPTMLYQALWDASFYLGEAGAMVGGGR